MSSRDGFSLIEMLCVLVLISMISVSVSLNWVGMYQDVQHKAQIEKIIDVDFKARRHAADRHKNCQLIFDLQQQTIQSSRWVQGKEKFIPSRLATGNQISKVRTTSNQVSEKQLVIPVSDLGATPTYAVQLMHQEESRWIIFAGRTGQSQTVEEESEVDELFASLKLENARR